MPIPDSGWVTQKEFNEKRKLYWEAQLKAEQRAKVQIQVTVINGQSKSITNYGDRSGSTTSQKKSSKK